MFIGVQGTTPAAFKVVATTLWKQTPIVKNGGVQRS